MYNFAILAVIVSIVLKVLMSISFQKKSMSNKMSCSTFECGYDSWGTASSNVSLQFYMYIILFIIFDLELILLFPFSVVLKSVFFFKMAFMYLFLFVVFMSTVYEWWMNAFDWNV